MMMVVLMLMMIMIMIMLMMMLMMMMLLIMMMLMIATTTSNNKLPDTFPGTGLIPLVKTRNRLLKNGLSYARSMRRQAVQPSQNPRARQSNPYMPLLMQHSFSIRLIVVIIIFIVIIILTPCHASDNTS